MVIKNKSKELKNKQNNR